MTAVGVPLGLPVISHLTLVVAAVLTFAMVGLYRSRVALSVLDDSPWLAGGVLVGALAATSVEVFIGRAAPATAPLLHVPAVLAAVLVSRLLLYVAARGARRSGRIRHRTLLVGAGQVGIQVAATLQNHPQYGLEPVGFLDDRPRVNDLRDLPVPVLGTCSDIGMAIREFEISQVIVAFSSMRESDLVDILRTCDRLDCEIFLVPRLFELNTATREVDDVRGIPILRLRRPAFRTFSWRLKRLMDVALSGVTLILLAPVLAACAAAVRIEGGPSILFRQQRVGLDGRPFDILKFRSMKPEDEHESQTRWNIQYDERLGPVGRFLRQTSLDELPQLWNILVGNMSLVGPRPERPYFVSRYSSHLPRYPGRHRVPAGLTGWAQINGLRGDTSIEERARFDNHYIENWSLWLDVKILLRTVEQVIRRRGG